MRQVHFGPKGDMRTARVSSTLLAGLFYILDGEDD